MIPMNIKTYILVAIIVFSSLLVTYILMSNWIDVSTSTHQETSEKFTHTTVPSSELLGQFSVAEEWKGLTGWINSDPFSLANQRGKLVLIDFWTYTCVNCIRTLPYLKDWHSRYADSGLVILGIHAPEFEFEKIHENVANAVDRFEIDYPVAQDNDFITWRIFQGSDGGVWPAKYLIDGNGFIRYTKLGEGGYAETEQKIRQILSEVTSATQIMEIDPVIIPSKKTYETVNTYGVTRELYAGFNRNYSNIRKGIAPYVTNLEYYDAPNQVFDYMDPETYLNHFIHLHGEWFAGPESLTHARSTELFEDYITIKFFATTANVVLYLQTGEDPYIVRVTVDEMPIDLSYAASDILYDGERNSYINVDQSRMYRLVKSSEFGGHELSLSSNSDNFTVFAYTFGAFQD